ncbi:amidohydrolase family protein [Akanthomyces lecanii RCEF 1005]|uniref:Amidohydrolase family protein n=1 Tax=Akanthomyces lecanii RCEF 1005 TaxID=1081108 RepID=A0A162KML9_CORDF|nr:amidohydrolase family protein [Akanthomyces lecanii RCEF 1005]
MASSDNQLVLPIIDAHIHLYPASELDTLSWAHPEHPLYGQQSLAQYKEATNTAPSLLGFIFVETDRKHDLAAGAADGSGWDAPLQEVRWLRRIALGEPKDGEGHAADDKKLCLGIVPWAPLPSGPKVLDKYLDRVKEEAGEAWPKVKGFRYLLQDKPSGAMLEQDFIDGLKLLGRRGFVFEVGVDQHRRGRKQLDELIELVDRVHDGVPEDEKPDFSVYSLATDASFHAWRTTIYALGKVPQVYMKLSGGFAEMPPALRAQDAAHIFQSTFGWLGVVLATFGARRIMFGSDWPVCTVDMPEGEGWPRWKEVVEKMCWMASLDDEERAMIFGGTAKEAYGL